MRKEWDRHQAVASQKSRNVPQIIYTENHRFRRKSIETQGRARQIDRHQAT